MMMAISLLLLVGLTCAVNADGGETEVEGRLRRIRNTVPRGDDQQLPKNNGSLQMQEDFDGTMDMDVPLPVAAAEEDRARNLQEMSFSMSMSWDLNMSLPSLSMSTVERATTPRPTRRPTRRPIGQPTRSPNNEDSSPVFEPVSPPPPEMVDSGNGQVVEDRNDGCPPSPTGLPQNTCTIGYEIGQVCRYNYQYEGCTWSELQCNWIQECTCTDDSLWMVNAFRPTPPVWSCRSYAREACSKEEMPKDLPRGPCDPTQKLPSPAK